MHAVTLTWAGGEHEFALQLGQLRALQDKCDAGPMVLLQRMTHGFWRVDDLYETIRLGLEGGGMSKPEARRLVAACFDREPVTSFVVPAQAILGAALVGPAGLSGDDGEDDADDDAGKTTGVTPPGDGISSGSMEPAQ